MGSREGFLNEDDGKLSDTTCKYSSRMVVEPLAAAMFEGISLSQKQRTPKIGREIQIE